MTAPPPIRRAELPQPARGIAFDGVTYDPSADYERLNGQQRAVFDQLMAYGPERWWTLRELSEAVSASEASVSARLRDLRKPKYGGHTVHRRRVEGGLWEYRLIPKALADSLAWMCEVCGRRDGLHDQEECFK